MSLTKERAQARSACIKIDSITYDFNLFLELDKFFEGLGEISFELINIPEELAIDLKSQQIKKVYINNCETEWKVENSTFLLLDVIKLKLGHNSIAVHYRNKYTQVPECGCISFSDIDTKKYLYTQFEPFFANRVFPVFDQPDLKAKMRLNIISQPQIKKIVSNEYAILQQDFDLQKYVNTAKSLYPELLKQFLNGKSGVMTLFPETKLLPTYLFCFVAGDYKQIKMVNPFKGIPMSLYSTQSLYQYLQKLAPFIFQITTQSLKFFQLFLGYPYSFNKYDQVFVKHTHGAMENAGIVTVNESYLFKQKVCTQRLRIFATTLCHQLSHHWFGNLVTMKWWDDLWLNESFADFISHFCLQRIKNNINTLKYESCMASFIYKKQRGYIQDQGLNTHPIQCVVPNTNVAYSIVDAITYSKGAATIKQLLILIGEDNFSKAMSQYLTKYAWKNATLQDFIHQIQKFFTINQFNLTQWSQQWLQKPSFNKLEHQWSQNCEQQTKKLIIKQSPITQKHPTLRHHKIAIGFFKQDCSVDEMEILIQPTQYSQVEFSGKNDYKGVLLNYGDYSYVKTIIDPVSLDFFSNNLYKIKDILSRALIWKSIFNMVKDSAMESVKYMEIFIKNMTNETSDTILQKNFDSIYEVINIYTAQKNKQYLNDFIFYFILAELIRIGHLQNNRTFILREKLFNFAFTKSTKSILYKWKRKRFSILNSFEMTNNQHQKAIKKILQLQQIPIQITKVFQNINNIHLNHQKQDLFNIIDKFIE